MTVREFREPHCEGKGGTGVPPVSFGLRPNCRVRRAPGGDARRGVSTKVFSGGEGLLKLATLPGADIVLIAIVGTAGLQPALAVIRVGKDIAVASKEILVMAGEIVMREAQKNGGRVLAVDSEHSAIFQCLDGKPPDSVRVLWLTASGGPFRTTPKVETDHRGRRLGAARGGQVNSRLAFGRQSRPCQ